MHILTSTERALQSISPVAPTKQAHRRTERIVLKIQQSVFNKGVVNVAFMSLETQAELIESCSFSL